LSFFIIPKTSELAKTSRVVSDLNENINIVETRAKRLNEVEAKLDNLKREELQYAKNLPVEKEIPGLLGIEIQSLTPYDLLPVEAKSAGDVYYREMPLLLNAKGGFHQIGEFVNNLEGANRFITVEDLRIQYDEKNPRKHNVRMVLKTYIAVGDAGKKTK
jgi:Tfp pilus assembly protein PilO